MRRTVYALVHSKILRRILSGFVAVAAILGVGLVVTSLQFKRLSDDFRDLLEHDVAVVDDTEQLQRLVSVLQSNKRGYLLTGDEEFRTRYESTHHAMHTLSMRLARDAAGRPQERAHLDRFVTLVDQYHQLSREEIALRQRVDRGEADVQSVARLMAQHPGAQVVLNAESELDALHDTELRYVDEQRRRVEAATVRSQRIAILSMVVGLLVAMGFGVGVSRDIAGAMADLKVAIEATGRREPVEAPRPRADEIGEVSGAFYDMGRQLARYADELAAQVREREQTVVELRETNDALARAMRVKSDFLATMSHELRTPLNAVIGLSDLLLRSPAEQLSPRAREALETMRASGSHLLALLDDILDLAKIDAGKMTYAVVPFDPKPVVRACVATALPLVGDKPVELTCEVVDAPPTMGDPQRVRQVLLNLLSNAAKFTDQGSIVVRMERTEHELVVRIRDTGRGISHEDQSLLFEDFQQVRSGDARPYGGTGLGLALSRRMARAMGGDVTVESEPRRGSTFSLRLGLAPTNKPESS